MWAGMQVMALMQHNAQLAGAVHARAGSRGELPRDEMSVEHGQPARTSGPSTPEWAATGCLKNVVALSRKRKSSSAA